MLVEWQYQRTTAWASQQADDPAQLHALLIVLHQRATADGYPHTVQLGPAEGSLAGPAGTQQPRLTLVVGTDSAPLWWDSPGGERYVSVGPWLATQPEPPDLVGYHHDGQLCHAPESSLISRQAAWQAARLFLISGGQQPATLTWRTLASDNVARGRMNSPVPARPAGHAAASQTGRFGKRAARARSAATAARADVTARPAAARPASPPAEPPPAPAADRGETAQAPDLAPDSGPARRP